MFFGGIGTIILSIALYRYFKQVKLVRANERVRNELQEIVRARQERIQSEQSTSTSQELESSSAISRNQEGTRSEQYNSMSIDGENNTLGVSPQICIVCLSEQREVILMDCGHVCVCAGCAMEIMATRPICPVCRASIVRVAPAFIA